jgi:hypothetical protein
MGLKIGANNTLNYNTASYGSPSWSPIPTARDVTLNLDAEEADASTRGGGGYKASEPTLKGVSFEWDMLEDHTDTAYLAIRAAYFAGTTVDLRASTAAATAAGELWLRAVCKIFGFKKGEPLNGVNTFTVTAKPCFSANAPSNGTNS